MEGTYSCLMTELAARYSDASDWSEENLEVVFKSFLEEERSWDGSSSSNLD